MSVLLTHLYYHFLLIIVIVLYIIQILFHTKRRTTTVLLRLKLDYFITKPTAEPRRTGDKRTYVSIFG